MRKIFSIILAIVLAIGTFPLDVGASTQNTERSRPKVINTVPRDKEKYLNPEHLFQRFPTETAGEYIEGYYLTVVFDNIENGIKSLSNYPQGITLNIKGESENIVDSTKEMKIKEDKDKKQLTLNIPLREKLKDNQTYNGYIPEKIIGNITGDIEKTGNTEYRWSFTTNYFPKADRLYEGAVVESYDWRYPIVIDGSMFHENTYVEFRASTGRIYSPDRVSIYDGQLYIYLPRRGLPVGLYDIIISNGRGYDTSMVYGVFSVVEEGDYIPNEEYRINEYTNLGIVKEDLNTSKTILELRSRHIDKYYLEIDLDELMGSDTWVRSIKYPVSWSDNLGELVLKSKWTNVSIRSLRLHGDADEKNIELRVGRVEKSIAEILTRKLIGKNIKSNFIEVSGSNFDFTSLTIEIPYFESDGRALKILRYDEELRKFEESIAITEFIDGKVKGITNKPGIFVVVE